MNMKQVMARIVIGIVLTACGNERRIRGSCPGLADRGVAFRTQKRQPDEQTARGRSVNCLFSSSLCQTFSLTLACVSIVGSQNR